ncbi:hypothetical protein D5086_021712 [Populus alba]|uniref:Uncharacterized protein n=1 Tax=Populus alba TaxID=43335 RepID=A0ACC4BEI0_POPAL
MLRVLNEEVMQLAINCKLSSTQQQVLAQDVTREEIKHAVFSLKNNKAPGPDGFNAVANPTRLTDFRPISCCNTIYKCIAKILAGRMKVVLPSLVGPYQTAFISGWRINDNILLSQELMKGYHKSTGPARCAMKVDLMKADDSVRWDFVEATLKKMGFPEQSLIGSCFVLHHVNSQSTSTVNLQATFKGGEG